MRVMRLMVRAGTCWIIGVAMMCVRAGVEAGLSAKAPQRRRTESCAAYISWWLGWLHGLEALRRVSGFSGGRRSSEGREGMRRMRRRVCLGGMGCRVGEGNSPCQRRRWRPPVSYSFRIGIKDAAIRPSAPSHIAPPRDSVFGQLVVNSMSALDRCKLHAGMRCLHPESRSRQGGVIGGGECVCRRGLMGDRSVGESPEHLVRTVHLILERARMWGQPKSRDATSGHLSYLSSKGARHVGVHGGACGGSFRSPPWGCRPG
jgi:hypothetical protein